jgi:hypothetical protein
MINQAIAASIVIALLLWFKFHPRSFKWFAGIGLSLLLASLVWEQVTPQLANTPRDYPQCILERMPGAANDAVARVVVTQCTQAHPTLPDSWHAPRGRVSAEAQKCILRNSAQTPSGLGARLIEKSCLTVFRSTEFDPTTARPID